MTLLDNHLATVTGNSWPTDAEQLPMYMTPVQLAELRGVSVRTLERDRWAGTGVPFVKLGRRIMYRTTTVLKYLQQHEFTSTAEARRAQG